MALGQGWPSHRSVAKVGPWPRLAGIGGGQGVANVGGWPKVGQGCVGLRMAKVTVGHPPTLAGSMVAKVDQPRLAGIGGQSWRAWRKFLVKVGWPCQGCWREASACGQGWLAWQAAQPMLASGKFAGISGQSWLASTRSYILWPIEPSLGCL